MSWAPALIIHPHSSVDQVDVRDCFTSDSSYNYNVNDSHFFTLKSLKLLNGGLLFYGKTARWLTFLGQNDVSRQILQESHCLHLYYSVYITVLARRRTWTASRAWLTSRCTCAPSGRPATPSAWAGTRRPPPSPPPVCPALTPTCPQSSTRRITSRS